MIIDQVPAALGALRGKVIIMTGAGRGIGREAARVLARMGARVVVAEIQEAAGRETAERIRAEGGEAIFVPTDVASEASMAALREQTLAAYGEVDMVVNNATIFTFGRLWELDLSAWDRVMSVNLRGAFLSIKTFLPDMLARKSGVIVTMESSEGMPYLAPYLASKVALRSLAISLAQEVGEESGVSVFCFGPGMVSTPGLAEALAALPPLYGMSQDEFIKNSGVTLADPEVCATGLAGTLLYAREYHGQQAFFTQGLGKLGLNVAGEPVGAGATAPAVEAAAAVQPAPTACEGALALNLKLEGILRDHIREYSELTMFQRPVVRRMFQSGTGFKVEEWLANAETMTRQLQAGNWREIDRDTYVGWLRRLAGFIKKQESDARGFFRNQDDLNRALAALGERQAVVNGLADALAAVN
ncbi:MAG TPA: SDR family oxidoreductase [Symbiobacteriaceae bacterium]|nr:SDR family oxidoreductase [Symbiobacteriaceae bacterium]